ncbi:MAG: PD-(D/E)XK nuclease family protein [Gemmataceae bacterium]
MSLSPKFLADLADVYATLRPQALSVSFLTDLAQVYATLPVASDDNLLFLARRFDEWRRATQEFVRTRLAELDKDDPLRCSISLFRTMDYGRLETAHTRALAWLLDPKGEHGFGTTLLAALLRRLSRNDCTDGLRVERVESECAIDSSGDKGRLDVLAEGTWEERKRGRWVLVIEAKVDAWEGEDQLKKYEEWLRSNTAGREVFRVFLTPDRLAPETSTEEWESLSFLELVRIFRAVYGDLRDAPGFHFLRFYLAGVLQDVCGFPRNVADGTADPYAIASYLKTVHESLDEGASHDAAR